MITKLQFHSPESASGVLAEKWWALRNIRVPQAWHIAKDKGRGEVIVLAVERRGVHHDLEDDTYLASLAVGRQQGELSGAAPAAQIVTIAEPEQILEQVKTGAGIILLACPVREEIIKASKQSGAVVIAAAGEEAMSQNFQGEAIIVCGSTHDDQFWVASNSGSSVAFAAPSHHVWSGKFESDDDVLPVSGTLAAAALVAGTAALWRSHNGGEALTEIAASGGSTLHDLFMRAVQETARCPKHWDEEQCGAGIIDAEALMRLPLDRLR